MEYLLTTIPGTHKVITDNKGNITDLFCVSGEAVSDNFIKKAIGMSYEVFIEQITTIYRKNRVGFRIIEMVKEE